MFNFIRKKMNKKGFTLVELLVVIAVLGIIAGIAVPRMSGITTTFKTKADEQTAINLARQVELRIQIGSITAPVKDAKAAVLVTSKADTGTLYFGEVFTEKSQVDKTKDFVITIDETDINVYIGTADTLPGTNDKTIYTQTHGGKIE